MAFLCHITLTSTSIPSVIFPLYSSKRRCTGSALIRVELQAGVLHSFKRGSNSQNNILTKVVMVIRSISAKGIFNRLDFFSV